MRTALAQNKIIITNNDKPCDVLSFDEMREYDRTETDKYQIAHNLYVRIEEQTINARPSANNFRCTSGWPFFVACMCLWVYFFYDFWK